jgi:hypothetical protein
MLKLDINFTVSDFSYGRLGFTLASDYLKKFTVGPGVYKALLPKSGDDTLSFTSSALDT